MFSQENKLTFLLLPWLWRWVHFLLILLRHVDNHKHNDNDDNQPNEHTDYDEWQHRFLHWKTQVFFHHHKDRITPAFIKKNLMVIKSTVLGWGLLSQFSPFRYFPHFPLLSKQTLAIEYGVHIWQVSPQLSCGDTCQIWMWFRESNMYFCETENFAYGEINERSFSNPHTWLYWRH